MSLVELHEDDQGRRRLDFGVWRRILAHARPYRHHAVGLGGMATLIAGCEVLFPYITGRIIDQVAAGDGFAGARPWAWAYAVAAAILCLSVVGFILLAGRIATGVSHDIRRASFAKLQELPFSYYDRRPIGWIMSRLTSDCDRLSRIIGWTLLDFLWGSTMALGIAAVMLYLNWRLALVVLSVVLPLAVVSSYFQRRLLRSARAIRKANGELTASFNENITGVRTSKALVHETENLREFQAVSSRMYEHTFRNSLESAIFVPIVVSLGSLMAGLALYFGGGRVVSGSMSLGALVTFMNYAGLIFHPVQEMARQLMEVQMAQAAAERIQGLLDTDPEIRDAPDVRNHIRQLSGRRQPPHIACDGGRQQIERVEFRDVSFAYGEDPVIDSLNLSAAAGETVALVGATGGGKSTIVNLLCRFYEPTSGSILLDGVDYRRRSLHWLQSNLGIVLQTPHLFSGTIRDNIRYGRLDATQDELVRAARLVGADEFISRLADGYDAEVGEGGGRLSTGQKQLVALARAVLADPQIFILDEATASVDTETESQIERAIGKVLAGRVSFVIAHRLSTIRRADRILVIEAGRIVESGDHDALMASRGRYFRLYSQQISWRAN